MTQRTPKFLMWPLVVVLALALGACSDPDPTPDTDPDPVPTKVTVIVDHSVTPFTSTVEGLYEGDPARSVGAVVDVDGNQADLMLNEVLVAVHSQAELDSFLGRWDGEVVDAFTKDEFSDPHDPDDYLVRVNPAKADADRLVADLLTLEPYHEGEIRVSNQDVLHLLAIAVDESVNHGTEVSLNWIFEAQGITEGTSIEAPNFEANPRNAFEWSYMNSGSPQDIGVGGAWQLLEAAGKLSNRVRIMIVDGGFSPNRDFPEARKIRQARWF